MGKLLRRMKQVYVRSLFKTGFFSVVFNPFFFIRRGLMKGIRKHAPALRGNLLDFGCGKKPYRDLFSADEYVGVDIRDNEGHSHEGEEIDAYYDGETLPFPDGRFDSLFSSEVLEHVPNVSRILDEWHRVLKKGGRVLVTTPFVWDEHEVPHDYFRYTLFGMRRLLADHGFEIIAEEKTTPYFETIAQLFILYAYRLFPRNPVFKFLLVLAVVFPLNLIFLAASLVFPRRRELYHNTVILAQKI
jgi:SAM-dependent methyltransferase